MGDYTPRAVMIGHIRDAVLDKTIDKNALPAPEHPALHHTSRNMGDRRLTAVQTARPVISARSRGITLAPRKEEPGEPDVFYRRLRSAPVDVRDGKDVVETKEAKD